MRMSPAVDTFSYGLHLPPAVMFGGKKKGGTLFLLAQFANELFLKEF